MSEEKIAIKEETSNEELDIQAIVEGLLFVVGEEGISISQLQSLLLKSKEDLETILLSIKQKYLDASFGIELAFYGNKYKFVTKKSLYPYLKDLLHLEKNSSLSNSALETLAIIAYKQPITRVEIEELRGVGADSMLKKLLARGLICEAGRADMPGKPILYEITEEFMDSFKLQNLSDLPELPNFTSSENNKNLFE